MRVGTIHSSFPNSEFNSSSFDILSPTKISCLFFRQFFQVPLNLFSKNSSKFSKLKQKKKIELKSALIIPSRHNHWFVLAYSFWMHIKYLITEMWSYFCIQNVIFVSTVCDLLFSNQNKLLNVFSVNNCKHHHPYNLC